MATDHFATHADDASSPARRMWAITPHASLEVDPLPKAIRADGDGTITLRAVDSAADVTLNVVKGEILPVRPLYVRATGTTVTVHGLG